MKESIGNAMLFNIIIVFVIILIGFFIGSLDYSKAYKVKNKIIEEIEKEGEAILTDKNPNSTPAKAYNENVQDEIYKWLKGGASRNGKTFNATGVGYPLNTNGGRNTSSFCTEDEGTLVTPTNNYEYCVYLMEDSPDKDHVYYYYRVVTFMYFDIPVVSEFAGNLLRIPVVGETMTFKKIDD